MSARKSLLNVWRVVTIYYIFNFLFLGTLVWLSGWKSALLVAVVAGYFHVMWWIELKAKILKNFPREFRCLPTHLEEFDSLDLKSLYCYTEALESLGFIKLVDYKTESATGLARVFRHPQFYCFADVFQLFPRGKEPTPVLCTLHSYMEDDWILSTTTVKPDGIKRMWRSPRVLWTYHLSATPTELFQYHLQRRQQMQDELDAEVLKKLSWEFYFMQQQNSSIRRRETFQNKNIIIALIEATLFEMNPASEWMGDYPSQASLGKGKGKGKGE